MAEAAKKTTDIAKTQTISLSQRSKNITDKVQIDLIRKVESKEIILPKNYSVENAMKEAYLVLLNVKDKEGRPALEVTTEASQAQALLKMATQGLHPLKNQCYFVVYGDQLSCDRSYMGTAAIAKRVEPKLKDVTANVIYEGDTFIQKIDENGYKTIQHETSIENFGNIDKIKGAYAIAVMDGEPNRVVVKNISQIKAAWKQGKIYSETARNDRYGKPIVSTHNKFSDEMCIKTVISNVCKLIINTSDDAYLFADTDDETTLPEPNVEMHVKANANKTKIDFEEAQYAEEPAQLPESPKPVPVQQAENGKTENGTPKENNEQLEAGF